MRQEKLLIYYLLLLYLSLLCFGGEMEFAMLNQQLYFKLENVSNMLKPFGLSILAVQEDSFLIYCCGSSAFFLIGPSFLEEFTDVTPDWLEEYIPNCILEPYKIEILPGGDVRDFT